ncbi:MAG: hypothetical protein Q4C65_05545 [Eubacteriales bacterium]|nr:hypothetical protein [Eubacteriales bacterium]
MMPLIYGVYCNYREKINAQLYELVLLQIGFSGDKREGEVSKELLNEFFLSLPEEVTDQVDMFFVRCANERDGYVECRFSLKDQKYEPCLKFRDNLLQSGILNGYFSAEEEESGEPVAIVFQDRAEVGEEIEILGKKYRVTGTHNWGDNLDLVPFLSLDEAAKFDDYGVTLAFGKRITTEQFKTVADTARAVLGNRAVIPDMPRLDQYQLSFYKAMILLAGLVGISLSLNYIIMYQYIIHIRRKELAVFLICGMTSGRAVLFLMAECAVLLSPGILLGFGLFHFLCRPLLYRWMPYLQGSYRAETYAFMLIAFIAVFELIFGSAEKAMMRKKEIGDILKKGKV